MQRKMTFSNDAERVITLWLEPWGEDYWIQPGETFDLVPDNPKDTFYFAVAHKGGDITVFAEGGCDHVRVEHDGKTLECGHHRPVRK